MVSVFQNKTPKKTRYFSFNIIIYPTEKVEGVTSVCCIFFFLNKDGDRRRDLKIEQIKATVVPAVRGDVGVYTAALLDASLTFKQTSAQQQLGRAGKLFP